MINRERLLTEALLASIKAQLATYQAIEKVMEDMPPDRRLQIRSHLKASLDGLTTALTMVEAIVKDAQSE